MPGAITEAGARTAPVPRGGTTVGNASRNEPVADSGS